MKKKQTTLFIFSLFSIIFGYAQTNLIKGKVIDEFQEPILGATIIVKGSSKGVVTDENGTFSIEVNANAILQISYIGMQTQEVKATNGLVVTLLQEVHMLDETVVTALGISREKKAIGYAAQELKGEQLAQGKDNNILNSLSGKIANVRITNTQGDVGSSRIVIRGETSIAGENQPLFVIDGIPVDNSQLNAQKSGNDFKNAIADINPDDIASVTVLKGPNASALYGARAAHGAIIITTKSGKGQKGLGINISSSVRIAKAATLPKFQDKFGQGAGGQFRYKDGLGGGVNDGVDESWGPALDQGFLIAQFDSPKDANGEYIPTPWVSHPNNVSDFFLTGITTSNGISIARNDENYHFRLGYNNEKQQSIVPGVETNRTNYSLNTEYKLTEKLKVGTSANYIAYDSPNIPGSSNSEGVNYRATGTMLQFLWFGRQVDLKSLQADYARNWNDSYFANPYWQTYYNTTSQERNRLIGNVYATYNILEGLDITGRTSIDYYNDRRKIKVKWGTSGTPFGRYSEDAYAVKETNTEVIATYTQNINDKISIDVLGGFNIRNKQYENNFQSAPRLAVPDLYTLTNSRDQLVSSNYFYKLRQNSLYGSLQVGYDNWLYVNVTGRNDWTSTLPQANNSYFYPSVTSSILLSELFDLNKQYVSYLKLRGGWALVGADAEPYKLNTIYVSQTAFQGNPLQTSSLEGLNPNLKPENTESKEIGIESAFFGGKLRLDATYYHTDSYNQILSLATSAASGYLTQVKNAGHIRNQGMEVQLGITPVSFPKGLQWDVDVNFGLNRSKVLELDKEGLIDSYQLLSFSGIQVLATVGQPYGTLFGADYSRNADGELIIGSNGLPLASTTSTVLGKFTPDWTGGIANTFTYKNLAFSFLIDASFGGSIFSASNRVGISTGVLESSLPGRSAELGGLWYYIDGNNQKIGISQPNYTTTTDGLYYANINGNTTRVYQDGIIVSGVKEDGSTNNTIVSAEDYYRTTYRRVAGANVYDASYVKLREVSLSYSVPKALLEKFKIDQLKLSLIGRNLWIIHKNVPNIDPEAALSAGNAQGVESLSLPTTRSWTLSLNIGI